ncbi:hypothetical protein RchiOBHm_Chr1g0360241 [Rosa chinensis]|uniref:Uncharacterized protein n=1 Tax=Rosa chinensis TaxID=74649 RepID=A0A2P6SIL1_ROSCH|nr:hypothetical protein RchiOBHm_Chr1g0360241 [Rosa chinensis]
MLSLFFSSIFPLFFSFMLGISRIYSPKASRIYQMAQPLQDSIFGYFVGVVIQD